jgi:hypothetical protein
VVVAAAALLHHFLLLAAQVGVALVVLEYLEDQALPQLPVQEL